MRDRTTKQDDGTVGWQATVRRCISNRSANTIPKASVTMRGRLLAHESFVTYQSQTVPTLSLVWRMFTLQHTSCRYAPGLLHRPGNSHKRSGGVQPNYPWPLLVQGKLLLDNPEYLSMERLASPSAIQHLCQLQATPEDPVIAFLFCNTHSAYKCLLFEDGGYTLTASTACACQITVIHHLWPHSSRCVTEVLLLPTYPNTSSCPLTHSTTTWVSLAHYCDQISHTILINYIFSLCLFVLAKNC